MLVTLALLGCGRPDVVTESPVRRLTPAEYNNTIRDLYGYPSPEEWPEPEEDFEAEGFFAEHAWPYLFPAEIGVDGFEGYADGQVASNYLVEQYQAAASHFAPFALHAPYVLECEWEELEPDGQAQRTCARDGLDKFANRAYRRPLTDAEWDRLDAFYDANVEAYGVETALLLAVQGILQTPQFLYLLEPSEDDVDVDEPVRLDSWQMASRLSYFLWDTMPDPELFELASTDKLQSKKQVRKQARRMLEDPRARDAVKRFHYQWLDLDKTHAARADLATYLPIYGAIENLDFDGDEELDEQELEETWSFQLINMRASMVAEAEDFVDKSVFERSGTLTGLLTDNTGLVSNATERVYGIDESAYLPGEPEYISQDDGNFEFFLEMRPAVLPERAGLLTLPAVLAARSHPVHPAPILRGKFILERVACEHLDPPPPGAAGQAPPDTSGADGTNRERLELLTSEGACASCHVRINPPGFAFEAYDSVGGVRTEDNGKPVDSSGSFALRDGETIAFRGGVDMARKLAHSKQVRTCYAETWASYALGRPLSRADRMELYDLTLDFMDDDDIHLLLEDIATSDAFRYRGGRR